MCRFSGASRVGLRQRGRVDERVGVRVDTVSMGLDYLLSVLSVGGGYAAMAMVGVFTQADVGGEKKSREELGKKLERLNDRSHVGICVCRAFVLDTGVSHHARATVHDWSAPETHLFQIQGNSEQNYTSQTLLDQRLEETLESVDSPSFLSRQCWNRDFGIGIVRNEDGVHEHVLVQCSTSSLVVSQERMMVTSSEDGAMSR